MKRKVMILMAGLLLISGSVFAQDVTIDGSGNVITGTNSTGGGNLEVIGSSGEDGIRSSTSGTGAAGVYGENTSDGIGVYGYSATGNAGYFQGKAEITGNLIVGGTVTGTGVGDITDVTAGTGLSGGGGSGAVTLNADTSYLQRRVSGTCAAGSSIRVVNADGTVVCETDDAGGGGGSGVCDQLCVDGFNARIAALETLLANFTKVGDNVIITGANLHVRNGGTYTDDPVDGTGNIIIGFNEIRTGGTSSCSIGQHTLQNDCEANGGTWAVSHKSGSHNLVVGTQNNYSSYGGIVVGHENTISAPGASVSGGASNTASNWFASVSGGQTNTASADAASVSGGQENIASGSRSSLSGGRQRSVIYIHDWRAGGSYQPN